MIDVHVHGTSTAQLSTATCLEIICLNFYPAHLPKPRERHQFCGKFGNIAAAAGGLDNNPSTA